MEVIIFDKDDDAYLSWIQLNSSGFVVNTGRGNNSKYFVLHSPSCVSISKTRTKGAYTQGNYRKICSNEISLLKEWFNDNYPKFRGQFQECPCISEKY